MRGRIEDSLVITDLGDASRERCRGFVNGDSPGIFEGAFASKFGKNALKAQDIQVQGGTLGLYVDLFQGSPKSVTIRNKKLSALRVIFLGGTDAVDFEDEGTARAVLVSPCDTFRRVPLSDQQNSGRRYPLSIDVSKYPQHNLGLIFAICFQCYLVPVLSLFGCFIAHEHHIFGSPVAGGIFL